MKQHERVPFDGGDRLLIGGMVVAGMGLLFSLFPQLWPWLISTLDPRGWPRRTWFIGNLLVVAVLFVLLVRSRR